MRTFRFNGPFGLQFTLATSVPGVFSITYPNRAQTEPPAKTDVGEVINSPPRSHSEIFINIPMTYDLADPNAARRLALPGTRIEPGNEPGQEAIVVDIQRKGIKVRDFAYESAPVKKTTEIFDPERAIGDHDFRLSDEPRTIAIAGRTLRRLLDIGWVKMKEAKERWHKMDWDSLAAHDERPEYPWRPLNVPKPSEEERRRLCMSREPYFSALSRAHREEELYSQFEKQRAAAKRRDAWLATDVEMGLADIGPSVSNEKKRRLVDDLTVGEDGIGDSSSTPDAKRLRLSTPFPPGIVPPLKQFPAPREAYDLEIYDMIESFDATSSTGTETTTPPASSARQKKTLGRTRTSAYL